MNHKESRSQSHMKILSAWWLLKPLDNIKEMSPTNDWNKSKNKSAIRMIANLEKAIPAQREKEFLSNLDQIKYKIMFPLFHTYQL
jgi:hypothetical protein